VPNQIPYYSAPVRLWGYDVGLLTQQPDRFAERFAIPIPGANEFFREVSVDDPWVQGLLCALEPNDPEANSTAVVNIGLKQKFGTDPRNYRRRALRGTDFKRSICNSPFYGGTTSETDGTISNVYQ
jgi:hypothetical protein